MNSEISNSLSEILSGSTITIGSPRGRRRGVISLALDELLVEKIEHSLIVLIDNADGRLLAKLKFEVRFLQFWPQEQVSCVGSRGRFASIRESIALESIPADLDRPCVVGMVRDAVVADDFRLYSLALDGRLFSRTPEGHWSVLIDKDTGIDFHRIAQGRVPASCILAASVRGGLFRLINNRWSAEDIPSSSIVNSIWMFGDNSYVACGMNGLLIRGRGSQCEVIGHSYEHENFWSVCQFENAFYVCSLHHLYRLDPSNELELIDPLNATTFHKLAAAEGVMWSIGGKDLLELSSGQWIRIL